MIVTALVLGAVLLSILGIVASFATQHRTPELDERSIDTPAQLDVAISIQRALRIVELRRRMTDKNHLSYTLLGLAFLMQIVALWADHFAHLSIAAVGILPALFAVSAGQAARRRSAKRQLDTYLAT